MWSFASIFESGPGVGDPHPLDPGGGGGSGVGAGVGPGAGGGPGAGVGVGFGAGVTAGLGVGRPKTGSEIVTVGLAAAGAGDPLGLVGICSVIVWQPRSTIPETTAPAMLFFIPTLLSRNHLRHSHITSLSVKLFLV
jgi:hypothetical protein